MFNLIFGKKKSSLISIQTLGVLQTESSYHEVVLIQCAKYGKGVYLFHGGSMTAKDICKSPFTVKMSGELKKNPVSLLLQGGKPRELELSETVQIVESLDGFIPLESFFLLKKDLFPPAKTPKAKPEKSPAIEVKAEPVAE